MNLKTYATLSEIAAVTGREKSAVAKQAKKQGWIFQVEPGSARRRRYPIEFLPRRIARKVQAKAAILAMKSLHEAKKEQMPDTFMVVLDAEVYEIRRVPS